MLGAVCALSLAALLAQEPSVAEALGSATPGAATPASKKDAYLDAKIAEPARTGGSRGRRPARKNQRAEAPIWAHNLRTHEIRALTGVAGLTHDPERPDQRAAREAFFRCWFTDGTGPIPAALLDRIVAAAEHFEVREVRIISGFRHPKYNLMLRKKGHEVAAKSEHTEGMAIDFFLPGIETRRLYDWLLTIHDGGVGFYPISEFVHVDLGRKRTWKGT